MSEKTFPLFFFYLGSNSFSLHYKNETGKNIMADWLTTRQLKYRRHCPHLNGRYQAEFWLLYFVTHIFYVCNTFFCLRRFVWMCFLFVGYIEETGNKSYFSTQYTTVYVVLISSLSRSIRMVPIVWVWVWGIWDCVFSGCFFFPSGACQHYKWVIQSAQKLGSLTPLVA